MWIFISSDTYYPEWKELTKCSWVQISMNNKSLYAEMFGVDVVNIFRLYPKQITVTFTSKFRVDEFLHS
jgi:hypothetical protein